MDINISELRDEDKTFFRGACDFLVVKGILRKEFVFSGAAYIKGFSIIMTRKLVNESVGPYEINVTGPSSLMGSAGIPLAGVFSQFADVGDVKLKNGLLTSDQKAWIALAAKSIYVFIRDNAHDWITKSM